MDLLFEREGSRANSNKKYQSAQKYKCVSIMIFNVLILALLRIYFIYLYEL